MRYIIFIAVLFGAPIAAAVAPISAPQDPVVIYQGEGDFEDGKFNLELAIAGKGLKISNTLHISNMLTRTAKATKMPEHPYQQAESVEFCSAVITHKMSQANPANMALCPLTISIYSLKTKPDQLFLAYRRPTMMGDSQAAEQALIELLYSIIMETLE